MGKSPQAESRSRFPPDPPELLLELDCSFFFFSFFASAGRAREPHRANAAATDNDLDVLRKSMAPSHLIRPRLRTALRSRWRTAESTWTPTSASSPPGRDSTRP